MFVSTSTNRPSHEQSTVTKTGRCGPAPLTTRPNATDWVDALCTMPRSPLARVARLPRDTRPNWGRQARCNGPHGRAVRYAATQRLSLVTARTHARMRQRRRLTNAANTKKRTTTATTSGAATRGHTIGDVATSAHTLRVARDVPYAPGTPSGRPSLCSARAPQRVSFDTQRRCTASMHNTPSRDSYLRRTPTDTYMHHWHDQIARRRNKCHTASDSFLLIYSHSSLQQRHRMIQAFLGFLSTHTKSKTNTSRKCLHSLRVLTRPACHQDAAGHISGKWLRYSHLPWPSTPNTGNSIL